MPVTAALLIILITGRADELELQLVKPEVLTQRLKAGEVPSKDRQDAIAALFRDTGCEVALDAISKRESNVVCALAGRTPKTITVGGHLDFVERGHGIVDDWSGAALLASLYETLKTAQSEHTFRFVAFSGEERGLVGSSKYVAKMSRDARRNSAAFVNLECLGLTEPKVWARRASPVLLEKLAQVANSIHSDLQGVNVDRVGNDDSAAFLSAGIPVITIHSLTQETFPILHSRRDNLSAVNPGYYYDAYRLVAFYLEYLDRSLPASATNP